MRVRPFRFAENGWFTFLISGGQSKSGAKRLRFLRQDW